MDFESILKELIENEVEQEYTNPHLAKFYLRKWYMLQQNINYPNDLELIEAKILYSSLSELDGRERDYLAEKYFTPLKSVNGTHTWIKDKIVAGKLDMSYREYKAKRQRAENELNLLLNKYQAIYKSEQE